MHCSSASAIDKYLPGGIPLPEHGQALGLMHPECLLQCGNTEFVIRELLFFVGYLAWKTMELKKYNSLPLINHVLPVTIAKRL